VKARAKKSTEPEERTYVPKIKFEPRSFKIRDLGVCPVRDGAECWESTDEFRKQTDCELLEVLLRRAMPQLLEVIDLTLD
jgi:hypothetical protein